MIPYGFQQQEVREFLFDLFLFVFVLFLARKLDVSWVMMLHFYANSLYLALGATGHRWGKELEQRELFLQAKNAYSLFVSSFSFKCLNL